MIFLKIFLIHLAAVSTPGPDFTIVVNRSLKEGMMEGLKVSIGIGVGLIFHVLYSLYGVDRLFGDSEIVMSALKVFGPCYIIYIGAAITYSTFKPKDRESNESSGKTSVLKNSFITGLLTNFLNFKATLYFISIFGPVLADASVSESDKVLLGTMVVIETVLWFCLLSFLFSRSHAKRVYDNYEVAIDRGLGALMVFMGLSLFAF